MKKTLRILGLAVCLLVSPASRAGDLIVALSPNLTLESATAQAKGVLQFLTQLEPGDRAIILDGHSLSLIGEFVLPEDRVYNSAKARLSFNGKAVGAVLSFAKASQDNGDVPGAIRLPQLLRHIADNYAPAPATDLVIFGSPLYLDRDEAFSMTERRFPGDGHLVSSVGRTPYGATDHTGGLQGVRVHLAFAVHPDLQDETYRFYVQRFWTLFVEALGGQMVSFVDDMPTLFRRVRDNAEAPSHNHAPDTTDKLEMIRLNRDAPEQTIFERPISASPLSPGDARRAENVTVGISWECPQCDVDLWAKAFPTAQPLYFGNTKTPQGRYWKDFTRSPALTNGQETIGFEIPIDLATLTLAVNFYSGESPGGVQGEIRISAQGQTFAVPFHIPADRGNAGASMKQVMDQDADYKLKGSRTVNPHTIFINPLSVVSLGSHSASGS